MHTISQNYVIQSTNLATQRVVVGQAQFTLEDATAIIEVANSTADAWFYEMVSCEETGQYGPGSR